MICLDKKALAAKAWADLEFAASAWGALEDANVTLPIEKVCALVNERSALPSSPVSELVADLRDEDFRHEMQHLRSSAEIDRLLQQAASTITTLSTRNAELERQIDRLAAYIMENVPGEPSENQGAVDTAIRLLGKNAELEREVERCHARLEIDHEWVMGGNDDSDLERREIPFAERTNQIDGIECRDATIYELEREVKRLREAVGLLETANILRRNSMGDVNYDTFYDGPSVEELEDQAHALSTTPQGGEHE